MRKRATSSNNQHTIIVAISKTKLESIDKEAYIRNDLHMLTSLKNPIHDVSSL